MRQSFQMSFHSMKSWEGGWAKKQEPVLCPTGFTYDEIHKMGMKAVQREPPEACSSFCYN